MVTQQMLRTHEGKSLFEEKNPFVTDLDLINSFKQIIYQKLLPKCAPISEFFFLM